MLAELREILHSVVRRLLLRLWRPPLQPGEWRTLGLFAAADGDRLEEVLASMPLRVWRTDEVTPLSPHPNDPPPTPGAGQKAAEFLVTFTLAVPPGTPGQTVHDTKAREAQAAHDLAGQGHLLRLWTLPDGRALGLYQARDAAQMEAILASLPLAPWMTVDTTPLSPHPSDPAIIHLIQLPTARWQEGGLSKASCDKTCRCHDQPSLAASVRRRLTRLNS